MSDGIYALIMAISILASAVGLWSSIRRRQLMRRVLRSLTEQQLKNAGIIPSDGEKKHTNDAT